MQRRVAIRVDSSHVIGTGHLVRCLTLANMLRNRGVDVVFICRDLPGSISGLPAEHGFALVQLEAPGEELAGSQDDPYLAWLAVPVEQDAEDTLQVIAQRWGTCSWLVVDHYALAAEWEASVRPCAESLFAIDDLRGRRHDCDLILDQNAADSAEARRNHPLPLNCDALFGPRFALLSQRYSCKELRNRKRSGQVRRLHVFFGGIDSGNLSERCLLALRARAFADLEIDVVVGKNNPHRNRIENLCREMGGTSYYCQVPSLAELLARADLAIGSGGTSSWERCCLGVPSIMINSAENQLPVAEQVARKGAGIDLGTLSEFDERGLIQQIEALLNDPQKMAAMSSAGKELVDGKGAERVVEKMLNLQAA